MLIMFVEYYYIKCIAFVKIVLRRLLCNIVTFVVLFDGYYCIFGYTREFRRHKVPLFVHERRFHEFSTAHFR